MTRSAHLLIRTGNNHVDGGDRSSAINGISHFLLHGMGVLSPHARETRWGLPLGHIHTNPSHRNSMGVDHSRSGSCGLASMHQMMSEPSCCFSLTNRNTSDLRCPTADAATLARCLSSSDMEAGSVISSPGTICEKGQRVPPLRMARSTTAIGGLPRLMGRFSIAIIIVDQLASVKRI